MKIDDNYKKPIKRSYLRAKCGMAYYGFKRKQMWKKMDDIFAQERIEQPLEYKYFEHKTLLLRKLKDVEELPEGIRYGRFVCKQLRHSQF